MVPKYGQKPLALLQSSDKVAYSLANRDPSIGKKLKANQNAKSGTENCGNP